MTDKRQAWQLLTHASKDLAGTAMAAPIHAFAPAIAAFMLSILLMRIKACFLLLLGLRRRMGMVIILDRQVIRELMIGFSSIMRSAGVGREH